VNALKTLQVHVSRLRKELAPGVLVTREHAYELHIEDEDVDARRFEALLESGRGALAAGRPDRALADLEQALALWRGAPLDDLAYEPFAQTEIARLEDLRVAAIEHAIEAKLALGRHGEVIAQLEQLVEEHPYREALHAQLMLALYRADRQADALQAYQNARRHLVEDLGIEPGARLRELEAAVLAQDVALAVREGDDAVVRTGTGEVRAKVSRMTRSLEPRTRTMLAELVVDNVPPRMYPGQFVDVQLRLRRPPRPLVRADALVFRGNSASVAVLDGRRVRMVPVVTGEHDGTTVEVLQGLRGGEEVVLNAGSLADGALVQPVPQGGARR
jgi:DNA-binding SARP family transcriptional activator